MEYNNQLSENDKRFADEFSNYVNGKMASPRKVGKALADDHRYLVNEKAKLMFYFIEQLAENWHKGRYDQATNGRAVWQRKPLTIWRKTTIITYPKNITKTINSNRYADISNHHPKMEHNRVERLRANDHFLAGFLYRRQVRQQCHSRHVQASQIRMGRQLQVLDGTLPCP